MKSELSAVTRRDTNKLIASAIPQQSIISDAVSNQRPKLYKKVSVKQCKLSISPNRKGFKKVPKIQHRCSSSILPTKNQSVLVNTPFHDTKLVVRDVTKPIIGHAKPGGIASRSSISHSPSRSFSKKKLEKGRKHIKRSPLRSPSNSPMKNAFEKHRREVAAFVKLKSSEINYLKECLVQSNVPEHGDSASSPCPSQDSPFSCQTGISSQTSWLARRISLNFLDMKVQACARERRTLLLNPAVRGAISNVFGEDYTSTLQHCASS